MAKFTEGDISLGAVLAAGMMFFVFAGYFIGQRTGKVLPSVLIGAAFGIFFCGYQIWKEYKKTQQ